MTNLKAIGFTFAGGSCVGLACLIAFGFAVRRRHPNIAPRSIARPPDTIFNPSPKYKAQERGNAFTGWIMWTLKLSYPTMLRGVPGTGTRADGMKGKLLDVNLDGIVLLRFHAVCLRVALLTAVLALGVVLPLNLTAQCYRELALDPTCTDPENENLKLSDYERTTMANIPPLSSTHNSYGSTSSSTTTNDPNLNPTFRERDLQSFTRFDIPFLETFTNAVWGGYPYVHILVRLYTIVMCSWIVFLYTCSTLKKEWKEALALRRVYYLENDLWQRRKKELEATIYNVDDSSVESSSDEDDNDMEEKNVAKRLKHKIRTRRRRRRQRERQRFLERVTKDPWVPPPEQRETVPNIELYSVLVGELPRLPSEVAAGGDTESAIGISRAQAIDWQLAVVSTFFNHCVPNQPGFSSSVAAVTILPDAPSLALAWRKWYTAAAALRRLRFIRTLITERRHYEIDDESSSDSNSDDEDHPKPQQQQGELDASGKSQRMTPKEVWSNDLEMQLDHPQKPTTSSTLPPSTRTSTTTVSVGENPSTFSELRSSGTTTNSGESGGLNPQPSPVNSSILKQRPKTVPFPIVLSKNSDNADNVEARMPDSMNNDQHQGQEVHVSQYTSSWWNETTKTTNNGTSFHQQQQTTTFEEFDPMQQHIHPSLVLLQQQPQHHHDAVNDNDMRQHSLSPPNLNATTSLHELSAAPVPGMEQSSELSSSNHLSNTYYAATGNGTIGRGMPPESFSSTNLNPSEKAKAALSYYREVFGADDNVEVESHFFHALQFGPEQTAVYSRELAQGAANCCPNGCGERRLRDPKKVGIDELLTMEREAVIRVHNANVALQHAQARAAVSVLDAGVSEKEKDKAPKMELGPVVVPPPPAVMDPSLADAGGTTDVEGNGSMMVVGGAARPNPIEIELSRPHSTILSSPSHVNHKKHLKQTRRESSEATAAAPVEETSDLSPEEQRHRRVKSWSPRHRLVVDGAVANNTSDAEGPMRSTTPLSNSYGDGGRHSRKHLDTTSSTFATASASSTTVSTTTTKPKSLLAQGRAATVAGGGMSHRGSTSSSTSPKTLVDIMKLPESLNREAEQLVRGGKLRPEPVVVVHHPKHEGGGISRSPPSVVVRTSSASSSSAAAAPPSSKGATSNSTRGQSVRFLDQQGDDEGNHKATQPPQRGGSSYQRKYFNKSISDGQVLKSPRTVNHNSSSPIIPPRQQQQHSTTIQFDPSHPTLLVVNNVPSSSMSSSASEAILPQQPQQRPNHYSSSPAQPLQQPQQQMTQTVTNSNTIGSTNTPSGSNTILPPLIMAVTPNLHSHPVRVRTLTSDSQTSTSSLLTTSRNHHHQTTSSNSRFAGKMTLTSEGKIAAAMGGARGGRSNGTSTPYGGSSANNSNHGVGGIGTFSSMTGPPSSTYTGSTLDAFDPYSIIQHKKNDDYHHGVGGGTASIHTNAADTHSSAVLSSSNHSTSRGGGADTSATNAADPDPHVGGEGGGMTTTPSFLFESTRSNSSNTTLSRRKGRGGTTNNNTTSGGGGGDPYYSQQNNHTNSYLQDMEGLQLPDQWARVEQICAASSSVAGQGNHHGSGGHHHHHSTIDDGSKKGASSWMYNRTAAKQSNGGSTSRSNHTNTTSHHFDDGAWDPQSVAEHTKHSILSMSKSVISNCTHWAKRRTDHVVGEIQSNSTYAVVTFTNRQAAVAARHLLADGRGANRWQAIEKHPVPPLADSASCDLVTCRGCCRPLTLSVSDSQKLVRKILMYILLFIIYVFYTLPITFAQTFIKPESLYEVFPLIEQWKDQAIFNQVLSGIVPASLLALFFALCPLMFKGIANSGAAATSVVDAEGAALQYFWWFMLITAFSGSSIMTFVLNTLNEVKIGTTAAQVLLEIAKTIPTQVSATWLNWVILRFTCILPNQYLLQLNTFLFQCLGWNCCARASQGGGPGGCIPYRIYVDSGVVFMCTVSLSFASPIMAPVALIYYVVCAPLFRRNLIYIYRPKYDGGGLRWPFLFDVFISSMVVAQILLATMMVLKEAIGPCILAALPIIPTLLYRSRMRNRFLRAYEDAGLLQTSLLDEWDSNIATSTKQREEFRRFLVDAHKAAYIPVCIAGDATSVLTAEPAVVVPLEHDGDFGDYHPVAAAAHTTTATTPTTYYYEEDDIPPSHHYATHMQQHHDGLPHHQPHPPTTPRSHYHHHHHVPPAGNADDMDEEEHDEMLDGSQHVAQL